MEQSARVFHKPLKRTSEKRKAVHRSKGMWDDEDVSTFVHFVRQNSEPEELLERNSTDDEVVTTFVHFAREVSEPEELLERNSTDDFKTNEGSIVT